MSPGGVSQCNIVFVRMGTSKVLMTLPLQIQNSWQLPLLELAPSPACNTVTSTVTPHCNIETSSSDSTDLYISTVKHGPPQLMQHSHPTLAFKPIIPLLPIPSFLPLFPQHRFLLLAVLLRLLLPLLPLTLSGFFNGMLVVSKPGALNCYILFRPILLTLSGSRNLILTLIFLCPDSWNLCSAF